MEPSTLYTIKLVKNQKEQYAVEVWVLNADTQEEDQYYLTIDGDRVSEPVAMSRAQATRAASDHQAQLRDDLDTWTKEELLFKVTV